MGNGLRSRTGTGYYCSSLDDATSVRVAQQLRGIGFITFVLSEGIEAWRKDYPLEFVEVAV